MEEEVKGEEGEEMNAEALPFSELISKDLRDWFKEKWVDVSRKDKDGKHPPAVGMMLTNLVGAIRNAAHRKKSVQRHRRRQDL